MGMIISAVNSEVLLTKDGAPLNGHIIVMADVQYSDNTFKYIFYNIKTIWAKLLMVIHISI